MDHFLNCLDGGGGGIQGNFHENRMMQAHNGTLWNPSWKAVEMSQRAVSWSAFILTEHSKTHHGGLSRFAGCHHLGCLKTIDPPKPKQKFIDVL